MYISSYIGNVREYQVDFIHNFSLLEQKFRETLQSLHSSHLRETSASLWLAHHVLECALEVQKYQISVVITHVFVQNYHLRVLREQVSEVNAIHFVLEILVLTQKVYEFQVLFACLDIVLENDDVADSIEAIAEDIQGFVDVEILFVVFVEDFQDGTCDINLFEVRSKVIGISQRTKSIFQLKNMQQMRGKNDLILTEADQQRTQLLDNGNMIEIALLLRYNLLAEFSNIIDCIVLDHIEDIFLESQAIAISNHFQGLGRVYFDCFALSCEDIFEYSDFLQIFVSLES